MHLRLVRIAKRAARRIEQVLDRHLRSQLAQTDLEVQRHSRASKVERVDGSANLVQPRLEVLLLPLPEDVVEVAVMEVEKRLCEKSVGMPKTALGPINSPPGLFAEFPATPRTPPMPKCPLP